MANAHLEGDPRQPMARVSQVKSALQEASRRGGPSAHALVLAGDLNALLGEDVAFENMHAIHFLHSTPMGGLKWAYAILPLHFVRLLLISSMLLITHYMLFVALSHNLPQGR